jgi:hypothetical protein
MHQRDGLVLDNRELISPTAMLGMPPAAARRAPLMLRGDFRFSPLQADAGETRRAAAP